MCTSPKEFDGCLVACRECDDCISARKNQWVARCMAEKAIAGEALVMGLTYRNDLNGDKPLGARAFRYSDVQKFLKAVREAYFRKYKKRGEISFIIAGEQGSKGTKRVHWHIILFADKPLGVLGKWTDIYNNEVPHMKVGQDLIWSLWPHGMLHPQEPNQAGMEYVLKYALKDQFNVVKSKGKQRFSKSENHAASKLVMSKNPPLGLRWLESKLDEWRRMLVVPTSLQLNVPGYTGYWYPLGMFRERLLDALHEINVECNQRYGRNCAQWNALLATVSEEKNNVDWEGLIYGQIVTQAGQEGVEQWSYRLQKNTERRQIARESADAVRRCCGIRPCDLCANALSAENNEELRREEQGWFKKWVERGRGDDSEYEKFKRWWLYHCRPSRGCLFRDDPHYQLKFKGRRAINRLERKFGGFSKGNE